jgi:hypothetical protein
MRNSIRALGLVTILFLSSCAQADQSDPPAEPQERGFSNFQTAVASADADGYTPYWLGREFEAGGMTFKGSHVSDYGGEIEGGLNTNYIDVSEDGLGILITLYGPDAWARNRDAIENSPNSTSRPLQIAGRDATLMQLGRFNKAAVVYFDDTVVVASVSGSTFLTPQPEPNPLVDEATFLAVLENLRPYPE